MAHALGLHFLSLLTMAAARSGSDLKPLRFTPAKSQTFWLCNCKYTRTPPYCDAAHNRLPELRARRATPDTV